MGQAPAGLNATGESDVRWFYDSIKAQQNTVLRPAINKLVQLAFHALKIPEPANWTIRFNPLWQMTEEQQAAIRKTQAETDAIYINAGVVTPEEIALSRFGGDAYSTETVIDADARKELFGGAGEASAKEEPQDEEPPPPGEPATPVADSGRRGT
jgi:hypothetical protein